MKKMVIVAAAAACFAVAGAVTVDANLPAGNVLVEDISGNTVRLRQDLRDTAGEWFYWAFRVTGAAGRTLTFDFTNKKGGGGPVGVRGPVVSTDGGKTFSYPLDGKSKKDGFTYTFGPQDDEVLFYECHPYVRANWDAFVAKCARQGEGALPTGKYFVAETLCKSRKGADVPCARFGCIDREPRYRFFVSARHHCSETMASWVLEGIGEAFLADDDLGRWLRANVELMMVPFTDYDGAQAGDQGKNRKPHDHNRDYLAFLYPETKAITEWIGSHAHGTLDVFLDVHCPWIRGRYNEWLYTPWKNPMFIPDMLAEQRFSQLLEEMQCGSMRYRAADDLPHGKEWNKGSNYKQGWSSVIWAYRKVKGLKVARTYEVPFANANGAVVTPETCRELGHDTVKVLRMLLEERSGAVATSAPLPCVSGVYPHLAMFNDEGECGTGAVVPWAGDLWVITYGPHCPLGSSDNLYRIRPDLTRETFLGSVGGTHANRMIHRETNQLLIGPYVIDAKGNVRVIPPMKMPGRLTANARHLVEPDRKVYYATMEAALFEVDLKTLEVNTLIQDDGINKALFKEAFKAGNAPKGWNTAPVPKLPGYHGKGMMNGFGKLFYANNGERSNEAKHNPFIPSGALGSWSAPGEDWKLVRRCQFTEVMSPDGIYGNEHPDTNPVWTLGWDAKSVILGVTTNGADWAYYRLPKASHAYDGAHGWNTEWPRIRDVGFGDGTLLATMHGTFWRFPRGFSPANPNGIRPISTYLKVIGDFCRWGDRIVFGCDDQAKNEFLGKRKLKKGAPRCMQSQSNLWFVEPEMLKTFGPPSGEGYVWLNEDVKAGDVSDPYLHAGYASMRFTFTRADGTPVKHELVTEGDWVRVKCLEDAPRATARFRYGPAPCELPPLDKKNPYITVTDDNGKAWRFPNVNGDTNVVCREIATERDLLYVGGVWYELPAENAGGFAALRPIALADAPVKSLRGEKGLMYLNDKPMVIDDLWASGTASAAYWLWDACSAGFSGSACAAGVVETGKVFGAPVKVPDADKEAMALCLEGDRLYVGAGEWLHVYDVSNPLKPKKLGEVNGINAARQVAVQKGMAYVSTREYGLWIIDATDPTRPRIRSRFDCCELATGVDVAGDVCFLGQRQNGVEFIDVSDPDHPRHIAMRKTDESQSVKYRDGYLYSGDWGSGMVTVFDAHDMSNIRQVAYEELHGYGDGVWLQGNYLYCATGHHSKHRKVSGGVMTAEMKRFGGPQEGGGMGHGLDIFDISDPTHPKHVSRLDYPPFYARGLDMWTPRTSGNLLFAAQTHNGLFAVDITDKAHPATLDRWTLPNPKNKTAPGFCVGSVAVGNGVVYAAVKGAGVYVLPAKSAQVEPFDPGVLPKNASYREPYPTDASAWYVWRPPEVGQARAVAVRGDVVYAACGDAGLWVLEILPGGGFHELGRLPGHRSVMDVSLQGNRLFTAEGQDGFGVYELKGPARFREIARLPKIKESRGLALCVTALNDTWAFLSDRHGVDLYDIRALPKFRHVLQTGGCPGWDKYLQDAAVDNGRTIAFSAANTSLKWIDLAAQPDPRVAVETKNNRISLSNGICAFRDGLSLVSGHNRYKLLAPGEGDPANGGKWKYRSLPPAFPDEKETAVSGIPRSDGRLVAFTNRIKRRAALYDFEDAQHPRLLAAWKLSGNPDLAQFHKGKVVIPCGYQGVLLQK